jgi:hypothetical protein
MKVSGIGVASPNDVWAIGNEPARISEANQAGIVLHWDGKQWNEQYPAQPGDWLPSDFKVLTVRSPSDVWLEGDRGAGPARYHWDGTQWTMQTSDLQGKCDLSAIDIRDPSDMWVVNSCQPTGLIPRHWSASTNSWTDVSIPYTNTSPVQAINALQAVGPNDVWIVGANFNHQGTAGHWDGTQWTFPSLPIPLWGGYGDGLYDVAAISSHDVWAVGRLQDGKHEGLALHWDGTKWTDVQLPSGPGNVVAKIRAHASRDVWASGYREGNDSAPAWLLHWDGTKWSTVDTPNMNVPGSQGFTDIAVSPNGDLWATAWSTDTSQPNYGNKNDTLLMHFVPGSCGKPQK